MPRAVLTCLMIAAVFVACGTESPAPAGDPEVADSPEKIAWGEAEDGLQIGISFERRKFRTEEEITATVRARNAAKKPIVLFNFDLDWWHRVTLVNVANGTRWLGGAGLFIDVDKPLDVRLPAGGTWERTAELNNGESRFLRLIENRKPGDDWDYRDSLPPGRYRVSIDHEPGTTDEAYCRGTPRSNEVEIRVEK